MLAYKRRKEGLYILFTSLCIFGLGSYQTVNGVEKILPQGLNNQETIAIFKVSPPERIFEDAQTWSVAFEPNLLDAAPQQVEQKALNAAYRLYLIYFNAIRAELDSTDRTGLSELEGIIIEQFRSLARDYADQIERGENLAQEEREAYIGNPDEGGLLFLDESIRLYLEAAEL